MKRRKFIKIACSCYLISNFLPLNLAYSNNPKNIINKSLTDAQKNIMFNEGTERRFSSPLNYEKRKGFYHCANCDAKLFKSDNKYDSGTGWPSFTEALPGAFKTKIDYSFGM